MDISVRTTDYLNEDRSWLGSAHGTEATRTVTLDVSAFTEATHFPNGFIPSGMCLARLSSGLYGPYEAAGNTGGDVAAAGTVTVTATGGTYNVIIDGESSDDIAYNANAAAIQAAIRAIDPAFAAVTVTGAGPYTVTLAGLPAGVHDVQIDDSAATSGTVVWATTTVGAVGAEGVLAGHLFNSTKVSTGGADVGAPLLEHGVVIEASLPTNNGLDAAAKADVAGRIVYR